MRGSEKANKCTHKKFAKREAQNICVFRGEGQVNQIDHYSSWIVGKGVYKLGMDRSSQENWKAG